jgi:TRAP transporter TAXI family solute receptor
MRAKQAAIIAISLCLVLGLSLALPSASTGEYKPEFVSVVFPGTASVGYQSGSAMIGVFKNKTDVKFSITPATKTLGRFKLLKSGRAHVAWSPSIDQLLALTGTEDFKDWGPQSTRTVWDCGAIDQGLAARADSGIKTIADIKGKRICSYPTYPQKQLDIEAILAYANLTWDDVKAIPVSGFPAGQAAVLEGAVDCCIVSGQAAAAYELESSVHGIHWIEMPNETAADKAGWARFQDINPSIYPNRVSTAAGSSKENPVDIYGYSYQVACYDWEDQDLIYWFVKQMAELYPDYKDVHAYLKKWTVDWALKYELWFVPRAEGAIRYWKEVGKWTPAMEKRNNELLSKYPQRMTK